MNAPARRWWREPMTWLLVALPLASVVATIVLVRVGGAGASFDSAPEAVQRSAQVQQRDLAADERALSLGFVASLRRVDGGVHVTLDGATGVDPPVGGLQLALVHPADAAFDRTVTLDADGRAVLDFDPAIRWRLRLAPADATWRLVGTWAPDAPDAASPLVPALGPPAENASR